MTIATQPSKSEIRNLPDSYQENTELIHSFLLQIFEIGLHKDLGLELHHLFQIAGLLLPGNVASRLQRKFPNCTTNFFNYLHEVRSQIDDIQTMVAFTEESQNERYKKVGTDYYLGSADLAIYDGNLVVYSQKYPDLVAVIHSHTSEEGVSDQIHKPYLMVYQIELDRSALGENESIAGVVASSLDNACADSWGRGAKVSELAHCRCDLLV
jgi:hypothetical protein